MLKDIRAQLARLFPSELAAYVPASKLVAGIVLAVLAHVFGIGGDQVIELPAIGSISVGALALAIGTYFFPTGFSTAKS